MNNRYADRVENVKPSAIRQLLQFGADPTIISFSGGYPDSDLFPSEDLKAIYSKVLSEPGELSLQYTFSTGMPKLRQQIAEMMRADGIECTDENILIVNGGQQGLALTVKTFLNIGDIIATEESTYLGALLAFNPYFPEYLTIPMDDEGIVTDALEEQLRSKKRIKMIYTIPDFHNPTGITMSLARRKKLIELANKYNFIILEDTPYRAIRFRGQKLPTLKSMDTEDRVIFVGSFSKILVPGLRLGWTVASREIVDKLSLMKLAVDTQCSTLNMAAISLYLESFNIDDHINKLRKAYCGKMEVMLSALQRSFPKSVIFTQPDGGLFTWLRFPEGFDTGKFLMDHSVPEAKVAYVPGEPFFPVNKKTNYARLSFATSSEGNIIEGVSLLGSLLKKHI